MSFASPRPIRFGCLALLACLGVAPARAAAPSAAAPALVIFDTDIGGDIDDVYALALLLQSPELKLLGVTTVASDTKERARLAAKFLAVAGEKWASVPVYAGTPSKLQYMKQVEWAAGYSSASLHLSGGVEFLRDQVNAHPGEVTIIAVGELTNIAALLASEPGIGKKIKAIALMGGGVRRGYAPGSKPEPEFNLYSNAAAASAVFASGVPLLVAPLDSTADLKLTADWRVKIFTFSRPLYDALAALDFIWLHTNGWKGTMPTLFDALPVALVASPGKFELTPLRLVVDPNGLTREVEGDPNAMVALQSEPKAFLEYFTDRLTRNN